VPVVLVSVAAGGGGVTTGLVGVGVGLGTTFVTFFGIGLGTAIIQSSITAQPNAKKHQAKPRTYQPPSDSGARAGAD
jgi:hypothetical protein